MYKKLKYKRPKGNVPIQDFLINVSNVTNINIVTNLFLYLMLNSKMLETSYMIFYISLLLIHLDCVDG